MQSTASTKTVLSYPTWPCSLTFNTLLGMTPFMLPREVSTLYWIFMTGFEPYYYYFTFWRVCLECNSCIPCFSYISWCFMFSIQFLFPSVFMSSWLNDVLFIIHSNLRGFSSVRWHVSSTCPSFCQETLAMSVSGDPYHVCQTDTFISQCCYDDG